MKLLLFFEAWCKDVGKLPPRNKRQNFKSKTKGEYLIDQILDQAGK